MVAAGLLVGAVGAACLLLGTVALALVVTSGDRALVPVLAAWAVSALSCVIAAGLVFRGNAVALILAGGLALVFGVVLAIASQRLDGLVRVLAPDDRALVAGVVLGVAIAALVGGVLALVAIPQARRYADWLEQPDRPDAGDAILGMPAATTVSLQAPPTVTLRVHVARGRRRLYFALAGLALGLASGILVLVLADAPEVAPIAGGGSSVAKPAPKVAALHASTPPPPPPSIDAGDPLPPQVAAIGPATAQALVDAERAALARGDGAALAQLSSPQVFAFGVDADDLADDRAALATMLRRELGEPGADRFAVEPTFVALAEWRDHAWIALDLALTPREPEARVRRYAVTQLAAKIDGAWTVIAWHWARPIADAVAERAARAHALPKLAVVPDRNDATDALDAAVRAALGSRAGLAAAFSAREDAVNFGSAGEHVGGGETLRALFSRLRATIALDGGAIVVGGGVWDRAQRGSAYVGYAAANITFAEPGRAAQRFRVLLVLTRDDSDDGWKVVQAQFSNGGPVAIR